MKNKLDNRFIVSFVSVILVTTCLLCNPALAADYFHLGGDGTGSDGDRFDAVTYFSSNDSGSILTPGTAPGASDNLFFYRSTITDPLGRQLKAGPSALTFNSLTFRGNAGTTQINRDNAGSGSGSNTVINIGAGGITVDAGAGAVSFGKLSSSGDNQRVTVRAVADYTVANNSGNDLTFNREFDNNTSSTTRTITLAGSGDGDTIFKDIRSYSSGRDIAMTINKTSGTGVLRFDGTNTYTGATTVTAGTLAIGATGSLANTTTTIGVSGTLAGGGTIAGATTIEGTHSPGFSPGTQTFTNSLTYASTSTLNWELTDNVTSGRGTSYDAVNVTGGSFTLTPGAALNLTFGGTVDFLNTFWEVNQEWLVVDLSGTATAADSNLFSIGTITGGANWNPALGSFGVLRKDGSTSEDSVYLTWTAIPEPSSALLGGLGMLFLLRRRRK